MSNLKVTTKSSKGDNFERNLNFVINITLSIGRSHPILKINLEISKSGKILAKNTLDKKLWLSSLKMSKNKFRYFICIFKLNHVFEWRQLLSIKCSSALFTCKLHCPPNSVINHQINLPQPLNLSLRPTLSSFPHFLLHFGGFFENSELMNDTIYDSKPCEWNSFGPLLNKIL